MTHNDGKYFAYISVTDDNIKKGESAQSGEDAAHALRRVEESGIPANGAAGTHTIQAVNK